MKKILPFMLILPFLAFAAEEDKKEEPKAYYLNVASDEDESKDAKEEKLFAQISDEDEKDAEKEEGENFIS